MNYHGTSFLIFCFDFASTKWDKSPFIFEGEWGYEGHLEGGYEEHLEDWAASLAKKTEQWEIKRANLLEPSEAFVYIMGMTEVPNCFKLGSSFSPADRMRKLRTGNPFIYLCHKKLSNRIKGTEWFRLSEDKIISVLQEISQSPFEGIYGQLSCARPCF
jgi:hypothetical protein